MEDRSFRPWLVALVVSIGVAVALVLFTNLSGGYANVPWFVSMGVGVGATLACMWLIGVRLVRWRWVEEDSRPVEPGVLLDESVRRYQTALDRPADLTHNLQPLLHAAVADRLRRYHAIDLATEPGRAREVASPALLAVATGSQPVWPAQLEGLLADLDHLQPPSGDAPATDSAPPDPAHRSATGRHP